MFKTLLVILLSSVLVNNYVLNRFLGICPFLGVSKKIDQAVGMGVSVTAVMLLATAATWPIQYFVLDKLGLGYMQTIVFILIIASLVQILEIILKKFIPSLHKSLGVYLPLITTNCAVLGVALDNITNEYTFAQMLTYSIAVPVGFTLVLFIFSTIRERLDATSTPKSFIGNPIALIVAGLMALAFSGLAGLV